MGQACAARTRRGAGGPLGLPGARAGLGHDVGPRTGRARGRLAQDRHLGGLDRGPLATRGPPAPLGR
eukprot:565606-Alexandrium_andersonii.AAC.1